MKTKKCSRCGILNPIEVSVCDCGTDLGAQALFEGQLALQPDPDQAPLENQIFTCSSCGQRNRLKHSADLLKSRCAKCKTPFQTSAALQRTALAKVRALHADLVRSICARPARTAAVYQKNWKSLAQRAAGGSDRRLPYQEYFGALSDSAEDLKAVYGLLSATGFASAWYDLKKNEAQRESEVRATVQAVALLGVPEAVVQKQILFFEKLFRELLLMHGVGKRKIFAAAQTAFIVIIVCAFGASLRHWFATMSF